MKTRKRACWTAAVGTLLLLAGAACSNAFPLDLNPVTWESGIGDVLGWESDLGVGTVTSPTFGGNPGGYLNIRFDPLAPPDSYFGTLFTQAAGYTDDYTTIPGLGVGFDFFGSPSAVSLLLSSSVAGGSTWEYGFAPSGVGWESFWISLSNPAGWNRISGDDPFALALTGINAIGFGIQAPSSGGPLNYGLDNWQYGTPEPGTFASMSMLLLLGGPALRRKLASWRAGNKAGTEPS